ncbi:MAG: Fe(3+) dicitrate transport protein [Cryomorphaceae bacterium]|jgi:Fe(3+) dicitrate transport protein
MKPTTSNVLSLLAVFAAAGSTLAQENIESIEELDSSSVIGNTERLFRLAGSAAYLDKKALTRQNSTNINQVVARVPGVFARDETGTGFFPNLSIRGADGVRMDRTTVMEDGILMAPAPYSAPSAYYSPKVGRMRGLEILKGSSQVKYGPQTTGGVINYLSTAIPEEETFYTKFLYGSDNDIVAHSYYGNTIDTSNGKFGYLLEMFYDGSDGFRDVQSTPENSNPRDTGHSLIEPMLKLSWEPDTALKQKFEFRYGYSDLDANESYLGLTDDDFKRSPDMRYAGSRFDNISSQHHRTHLKYSFAPTDTLSFDATAYYNQFSRNWYKLNKVGAGRTSLHKVLGNPTGNATQFGILNGTTAGALDVKANSRDYESYGLQFAGRYSFEAVNAANTMDFGVRLHKDNIRRFQFADRYNMNANGGVDSVDLAYRGPDKEGNRLQESKAIAIWVENEMDFGKLAIKPGVRYEYVDQFHADYAKDASYEGSTNYLAPGIGFTYDINDSNLVYGGIYKGVSIAGPRASQKDGVDPEESIGYEIGLRHRKDRLNAEFALFYTDYSNIISSDAGLGDTSSTNAGAATVYGLEASVSYDLADENKGYSMPVYATATLTSATIDDALASGGEGDIYSGGEDDARIPYIPEFQASFGIAFETEKWGANLDATYIGKSFGTALEDSAAAGSSSRNGEVGDGFTVDLSGHYDLNEQVQFIAGLSNMFDERYISSRLPEGARANPGRTVYAGFEIKF